jgi:four helix bundle protein
VSDGLRRYDICCNSDVSAKRVEDLLVYQKALEAADEVSAILKRQAFERDFRLRSQLGASSERVASLMAEGFGQKTDRHFAHYLYTSRGSSSETRTQLRVALGRGHITPVEMDCLSAQYNEIERMLTGLIKHLNREDRRQRG